MTASLAPARCSVSELVRHALWSGRAPIHSNLGSVMVGVSQKELELQKRPLIFAHVVFTKMLSVCRARDIRSWITRRMDLWEKGQHAGLVGDAESKGAAHEGRAASGGKEEDKAIGWSYHDTVFSGKLQQAVYRATDREGRGCILLDDQCTKTGRPVAEVLREKHPSMHAPPVENPTCKLS